MCIVVHVQSRFFVTAVTHVTVYSLMLLTRSLRLVCQTACSCRRHTIDGEVEGAMHGTV